ncbi:MAG: SsrA-binding protein SmpB [Firmicutes bacterium]|nr:SsrA-binding protein SmpB [Candidatus Colivicinus equi]
MNKDIAVNRRAYHDYLIEDKYEAGIALVGTEIKSLRMGKCSLKEAYVSFVRGEAILKEMNISQYEYGSYNNHEEKRERKLLLHKSEIRKLANKCKLQGYTVIPLKLYFVSGKVKVEIALAKGKSLYDKREASKKNTIDKMIKQAMKY